MGGLSKKAVTVHNLTQDAKWPALVLSSGNMLLDKHFHPEKRREEAIAAEAIVQASRMMGNKIMGVGALDLAGGLSLVRPLQQPPDFTLLSLNVVDPSSHQPIFTPYKIISVNGLRIGILGLTDNTEIGQGEGFQVLHWKDSLAPVLDQVRSQADFIILLSNYSMTVNKEIATTFGAIDCILQAGHVMGNFGPIITNKALIVQTNIRGKYLGVLDIDWQGHGKWKNTKDLTPVNHSLISSEPSMVDSSFVPLAQSIPNDPAVMAVVEKAQAQIDTLRQHPPAGNPMVTP